MRDQRSMPAKPEHMTEVSLVPMTAQELDAFIHEEIAHCADEHVRDGTWAPREALDRARDELTTVIAWMRAAATAERQRLLTALNAGGECVAWLWAKLAPDGPWSGQAFLCQMTVARAYRRQGYGRSLLTALERLLAAEGVTELRLNVCESNLPAKRLYAAAGFETVRRCATMRQMRKRLSGVRQSVPHHGSGTARSSLVAPGVPGNGFRSPVTSLSVLATPRT